MKWKSVELGNITKRIRNGLNIRQRPDAGGWPITRIETISDQVINCNHLGYAGIKEGRYEDWYLEPGEIIFSHINSEERIGNCAIYEGVPYPLIHGMNLLCFSPNENLVIPKFLLYMVRSNQFRLNLKPIIKRAVNQASVSIGDLVKIKLPLPPISEQRRIVEILDQADRLRKLRANADAKAARILPALFYKMFGDPISNPLRLPTESVGNLLTLFRNGTTAAQNQEGRGYPVTRIETISEGLINPERVHYVEINDEEIDKWLLEPGDILFSHINSESHIGKTAIYKGKPSPLIHGMNLLLMRPDTTKVLPEYLFALLNTDSVRTAYRQRCKRAVNQASLNQQDISVLKVGIALKHFQKRFCQLANGLLMQIQTQKKVLRNFESLFNNLLHYAFNGDLTAKWREMHMKALVEEIEAQVRALNMRVNP